MVDYESVETKEWRFSSYIGPIQSYKPESNEIVTFSCQTSANESHIISFNPPNIIYTESNYTDKKYIKVMQLTSFLGRLPSFECGSISKINNKNVSAELEIVDNESEKNEEWQFSSYIGPFQSFKPETNESINVSCQTSANESHIISFEPPNIIYTESNYTKKAYIKVMQLTSFSGKLPSFKCGTTVKKNDSDRVIEYDTISQPNNSVQIFMLVTVLSIAFGRIYTCRQRNYAELKMKHKKILNRRTKHKARKERKRDLCYQTFGMKNFSKHKRCSSSGNLFPVNCSSDDEDNNIQEVNEKCSHQEPLVNINGGRTQEIRDEQAWEIVGTKPEKKQTDLEPLNLPRSNRTKNSCGTKLMKSGRDAVQKFSTLQHAQKSEKSEIVMAGESQKIFERSIATNQSFSPVAKLKKTSVSAIKLNDRKRSKHSEVVKTSASKNIIKSAVTNYSSLSILTEKSLTALADKNEYFCIEKCLTKEENITKTTICDSKERSMELFVDKMVCGGCANAVSSVLKSIDGIYSVDVNLLSSSVTIKSKAPILNLFTIVEKLKEVGMQGCYMVPPCDKSMKNEPIGISDSISILNQPNKLVIGGPPDLSNKESSLSLMDELRLDTKPIRRYRCSCNCTQCICSKTPIFAGDLGRAVSLSNVCDRLEKTLSGSTEPDLSYPGSLEAEFRLKGGSSQLREQLAQTPVPCGCNNKCKSDNQSYKQF